MDVILQVFVIFVAAKVAAELFVRLHLPPIAGELLMGILLGPHVTGVIDLSEGTNALSALGIVVLLFTVGLETPLSDLLVVGRAALFTSLSGIAAALAIGMLVVWTFGYPIGVAAFAGTALAASSVGVAARVFQDLGAVRSAPARVVLGAAVMDDVVVLALFPLIQDLGRGGADAAEVVVGIAGAVTFVALVALVGTGLFRRYARLLELPRVRRSPFVTALALCLGLAAVAEQVGLAALVGAFLAGMILAETRERYELDRSMQPLFDFLVPFFFVVTGAAMDPSRLGSGNMGFVVVLVLTTLAAKSLGAGAGAIGHSLRVRLQVGIGMLPRTEVTLVVATAGLASGVIDADIFSVLVAATVVSTLLSGPLLKWAMGPGTRRRRERERTGREALREEQGPADGTVP
jgi:Kef-type K+ transport system membrane component KefB